MEIVFGRAPAVNNKGQPFLVKNGVVGAEEFVAKIVPVS